MKPVRPTVAILGFFLLEMLLNFRSAESGYLFDWQPIIILASELLMFLILVYNWHSRRCPKHWMLMFWIGGWFGYLLVLGLTSDMAADSMRRATILIPSILLAFGLSERSLVSEVPKCLAWALVVGVVIYVVLGICIFLFGIEVRSALSTRNILNLGPLSIEQRVLGIPPFLRFSSVVGHPNSLGLFCTLAILSAIYLRSQLGRLLFLAFLCTLFFGLVMSISRSAMLALVIALVVGLFLPTYRKPSFLILLGVGSIACLTLIVIGWDSTAAHVASSERFASGLNERDAIWGVLIDAFLQQPFFGVGFAVSQELILENAGLEYSGHNLYLTLAAETGIAGLVFLFGVFGYALYCAVRAARSRCIEVRSKSAFLALLLIALMVNQLFEVLIMRFGLIHLLWIVVVSTIVNLSSKHYKRKFNSNSVTDFELRHTAIALEA